MLWVVRILHLLKKSLLYMKYPSPSPPPGLRARMAGRTKVRAPAPPRFFASLPSPRGRNPPPSPPQPPRSPVC